MKDIILYSGGLDSFITYQWVSLSKHSRNSDKIQPVYFQLGHKYQDRELTAIRQTIPKTEIAAGLEGLGSWEEEDAFIWHRNIFLVLAATRFLRNEKGTVWLTVQQDEMSIPDRSTKAFIGLNLLLSNLKQPSEYWKVETPWADSDKTDMVFWYLHDAGLSLDLLLRTWSCYSFEKSAGQDLHCGNCPACIRRYIALVLNGVDCTKLFDCDPRQTLLAEQYRQAARSGRYSKKRSERILGVL